MARQGTAVKKSLVWTAKRILEHPRILVRIANRIAYNLQDVFNKRFNYINERSRFLREALRSAQITSKSPIEQLPEPMRAQLLEELSQARRYIEEILANRTVLDQKPPSLSDAYEGLVELLCARPDVKVEFYPNLQETHICLVTDYIEIEGVDLGRFLIRLVLRWVGCERANRIYYVEALDPNPCGADPELTHPHVSNDILCEGDGQAAITSALGNYMLLDFFRAVEGILNNYNPSGAYHSIEDWGGFECEYCGRRFSEDEIYACGECGGCFCTNHIAICNACQETYCLGCLVTCEGCRRFFCGSHIAAHCNRCDIPLCVDCVESCEDCQGIFCSDCLAECEKCGKLICEDCSKQIHAGGYGVSPKYVCLDCAEQAEAEAEESDAEEAKEAEQA